MTVSAETYSDRIQPKYQARDPFVAPPSQKRGGCFVCIGCMALLLRRPEVLEFSLYIKARDPFVATPSRKGGRRYGHKMYGSVAMAT